MSYLCQKLNDPTYVNRHKTAANAFTRMRKLTFTTVFILILKKSVKSLQLVLNEWILDTDKDFTVTAGALSRARKKLSHTAYIELNEDLVRLYYQDKGSIKRFRGYRLLAFDGSKITLPQHKEIEKAFGTQFIANQTGKAFSHYSRATYQACYDVLNHIAVQSTLGQGGAYEVDLSTQMLGSLNENDLLIFDRGYMAYPFMVSLVQANRQFVIRCPHSSSKAVAAMFCETAPRSAIVDIRIPYKHRNKVTELGWPERLRVRLVRVELSSGEIEVLATSLFDEEAFSVEDCSELYRLRWGVETFFSKIKGRLSLENFTGKTVECVLQDFWVTVFLSNLETVMTEDVESEMNAGRAENSQPVKVNKAVSFNVIKKMALDIFFTEPDQEKLFERLERLFVLNPITVRENRFVPRQKISDTRSKNFQKRMRKHVF